MAEETMQCSDVLIQTDQDIEVQPHGPQSQALLEKGDHALFGVSTGNSYFSRERMARALSWATTRFEAVDVVYADLFLDSVSEALGHDPDSARRSASKKLEGVRRRLRGALEDVGDAATRVRCRPLSAFVAEPAYQEVNARTQDALRTDMELRSGREQMAHSFLGHQLGSASPTAAQMKVSLDYVDAELPFIIDTPHILGVTSSVHCYHSLMSLGRLLFSDRAKGLRPAVNQGYAVVACQD